MKYLSFLGLFAPLAACLIAAEPARSGTCANPDNVTSVQGRDHCLAIVTYSAGNRTNALVVVLHGDLSRGGTADYVFGVAREAAERNVVAVAMMRPGYTGGGRTSTGVATRSQRRHERYSVREIDSIGAAIERLKSHYRAKRLILVGHSGGALISGVLLGLRSRLIDGAILVSCPCDVPKWRRVRGRSRLPNAQSPHIWLERAAARTRIVAITGSEDRNTFPSLARDYIAAAKARGLEAEFVLVPGTGHRLRRTFRAPVAAALKNLLRR